MNIHSVYIYIFSVLFIRLRPRVSPSVAVPPPGERDALLHLPWCYAALCSLRRRSPLRSVSFRWCALVLVAG